jgi:hypothetical protein
MAISAKSMWQAILPFAFIIYAVGLISAKTFREIIFQLPGIDTLTKGNLTLLTTAKTDDKRETYNNIKPPTLHYNGIILLR